MKPSPGRIVAYRLSDEDADAVAFQREHARTPGNVANAEDVYPMLVVVVDGDQVNGRVILDGTDDLWVTGRSQGADPGQWQPFDRVDRADETKPAATDPAQQQQPAADPAAQQQAPSTAPAQSQY